MKHGPSTTTEKTMGIMKGKGGSYKGIESSEGMFLP